MINPELPSPAELEDKGPELLSGQETAEIISQLYEKIGPEWGCRLIEPNAVLAVAGLKPFAPITWVKRNDALAQHLGLVNEQIAPQGIELSFRQYSQREEGGQLSLRSLRGLETITKTTKIPGVPTFDSSKGFNGYHEWTTRRDDSLKQAQRNGAISPEVEIGELSEGLSLGYPDQAIFDHEHADRTHQANKLSEADIVSVSEFAKQYKGAVPEFDYYPEHANNPQIAKYINTARKVLQEFYESELFQWIARDPAFAKARRQADNFKQVELEKIRAKH